MLSMDKPWYRNLFGRPQHDNPESIKARADGGDPDAQFRLGLQCVSNEGGAQDHAQAAEWFLKAAEQSHCLAQFNLGVMYSTGQGVPRDGAKALMWFQKAAHQGDAGAQFNLGMSHYRASLEKQSMDTPESRVEAYKWFHLANAQGYKGSACARESVNLNMTREEVTDGNRRAAAFVAAKPRQSQAQ